MENQAKTQVSSAETEIKFLGVVATGRGQNRLAVTRELLPQASVESFMAAKPVSMVLWAGALVARARAGSAWRLQKGWSKAKGQGCLDTALLPHCKPPFSDLTKILCFLPCPPSGTAGAGILDSFQRCEAEEFVHLYSREEFLLEFHQVSWKRVRTAGLGWGPA